LGWLAEFTLPQTLPSREGRFLSRQESPLPWWERASERGNGFYYPFCIFGALSARGLQRYEGSSAFALHLLQ
jgi:hypothetical protein